MSCLWSSFVSCYISHLNFDVQILLHMKLQMI